MALERRNPLPPGRYWIHLDENDAPSFNAWRSANKAHVQTSQTSQSSDGWTWYLFTTAAPLVWSADKWGWPTVAGADVKSESDVVSRPDPELGPLERLDRALDKAGNGALIVAGALVVGTLVLSRIFK